VFGGWLGNPAVTHESRLNSFQSLTSGLTLREPGRSCHTLLGSRAFSARRAEANMLQMSPESPMILGVVVAALAGPQVDRVAHEFGAQ
jgi:hypothetical protein